MAGNHTRAPVEPIHDLDAHNRTYRGFLLLLKLATALSIVTLLALYFFLAR